MNKLSKGKMRRMRKKVKWDEQRIGTINERMAACQIKAP